MTQSVASSCAVSDDASARMHIGIIMDGNGRWAKMRGQPRPFGHRAGADALRRVLESCRDLPVHTLTLYAFSSENWTRPAEEVGELLGLLRFYLKSEIARLHAEGVRVRMIGDRARLPHDIMDLVHHAEGLTHANTRLTLVLALSYGGRQELTRAIRAIADSARQGTLDPASIDEHVIADHLDTRDIPDPDLIIRTSGEQRLSGFLLWQASYAELLFVDTLWPDFTGQHLADAIATFRTRHRRFGGV